MRYSVRMSSKGMKITYREGKKKWYGEFNVRDFRNGLGWSQWSSSSENLSKTVHLTEKYSNDFINAYH